MKLHRSILVNVALPETAVDRIQIVLALHYGHLLSARDDGLAHIPPLEGATHGEKIPRLWNCQHRLSVVVVRLGLSDSIYHHGQTTDDRSVTEGGDVGLGIRAMDRIGMPTTQTMWVDRFTKCTLYQSSENESNHYLQ